MGTDEFWTEAAVAKETGMSRTDLRRARESMEEGVDFVKEPGRAIRYTERGLGWLKARHVSGAGKEKQDEDLRFPKKKKGAVLWVARVVPNPRLVLAVERVEDVRKAGAPVVRVRVRDNKKMAPGVRLEPCREVGPGLWHYEGRHPRFKGGKF